MVAFLFPGQGAQAPGMLRSFCEQSPQAMQLIHHASDILHIDIPFLLWQESAENLARSDKSQIAIMSVCLASVAALREKNVIPSLCAGFSLGEWAAMAVSGVLSIDDTLRIVQKRGEIMQKNCEELAGKSGGNPPGMAAVLGLSPDKVRSVINESHIPDLYAVNFNSPKQTVVSGTAESLAKGESAFKEAGAKRVVRLKVAGPFHSPLMGSAAESFERVLEPITFHDPLIPFFSNVTGLQVNTAEEAKKNAVLHLTKSVLWTDQESSIARMLAGATKEEETVSILEVGPGSVLSGLWRDSGEEGVCSSIDSKDTK